MIVLVNGIGNIGSTLLDLLLHYKDQLNIDQIYAHKRKIEPWNWTEASNWQKKGVVICTSTNDDFEDFHSVLERVNYIFETTPNGVGLENKRHYQQLENLIACCAQGSEKGFGIPFMSSLNDDKIRNEKFVHVVSCNTHGSAALLRLFSGDKLENLNKADMVVVRRSEDIGNHARLVSANVVARHLDHKAGTHHSVDVIDTFKTLSIDCKLTSSDITTPSQLMHAVRFNIELKDDFTESQLNDRLRKTPLIASTKKFDSNLIFEQGRREGFNGRIYSQAIVVDNNILYEDKVVKGWAFVPQEGNTIISTLHAFLLQTSHSDERTVFKNIVVDLCHDRW